MSEKLFKGFDNDTIFLLSENRFFDSKSHYEEVKEILKQKATVPMRSICSDLSEMLFEIDEQMNMIPTKMVSRIRRDTRRSKNKEMYRDNMWCMFMRSKNDWRYQPCMWFEFTPAGFSVGVGVYYSEPSYFEYFRKVLSENQEEFRKAVLSCEKCGALPSFQRYKKDKPGTENIDFSLRDYYNARDLYYIYYSSDLTPLFDGSVYNIIEECIRAYEPMYKFLLKVMEKIISEKGQNYD